VSGLQAIRLWWPIPRRSQVVFAEAFRQSLVAGLPVDQAIRLAAEVTPSRRFRQVLEQMAKHVRSGYPLSTALTKTGARVQHGLLVALRTGEEHNCLDEALSAFVKRTGVYSERMFHRSIGRSAEAIRFAAALAGLLRNHPLTVREILTAGRIAVGETGRFSRVIEEVAGRMEDGDDLVRALGHHPQHFDSLYRGVLEVTRSRGDLRVCLERIGNGSR
jgi:type II secretory pathway component PulF